MNDATSEQMSVESPSKKHLMSDSPSKSFRSLTELDGAQSKPSGPVLSTFEKYGDYIAGGLVGRSLCACFSNMLKF